MILFDFDGALPNGADAKLYCIQSESLRAYVSDFGATIVAVLLKNEDGTWTDVALGYESAMEYLHNPGDMGGTIGRYAGRIAHGEFPLCGKLVRLPKNRPEGTIHGGPVGFHKKLWQVELAAENRLTLTLLSPDGDQGFPGRLDVRAEFAVDGTDLSLQLTSQSEQATVCSLTNHSYWNLAGTATVDAHRLTVFSDRVLAVDEQKLPTGDILSIENTPVDFRQEKPLQGHRCDHSCLLTFDGAMHRAAEIHTRERRMEVWTDMPSVQVYTADTMTQRKGKYAQSYGPRSGFCIEPQYYPDSPNHVAFPQPQLKGGEKRTDHIIWRFSTLHNA